MYPTDTPPLSLNSLLPILHNKKVNSHLNLKKNVEFMYKVEVQDNALHNMFEEKSMFALENDEETNQLTPPPLHEKLDAENFEKHDERTTYNEETRVDTPMELENKLMTIKDEILVEFLTKLEKEPITFEDREYK